jgi:hypothetical protein
MKNDKEQGQALIALTVTLMLVGLLLVVVGSMIGAGIMILCH